MVVKPPAQSDSGEGGSEQHKSNANYARPFSKLLGNPSERRHAGDGGGHCTGGVERAHGQPCISE